MNKLEQRILIEIITSLVIGRTDLIVLINIFIKMDSMYNIIVYYTSEGPNIMQLIIVVYVCLRDITGYKMNHLFFC